MDIIIPELNIEFHEVFPDEEEELLNTLRKNGFKPTVEEKYSSAIGNPVVIVKVLKKTIADKAYGNRVIKNLYNALEELQRFLPRVVEGDSGGKER